MDEERIGPPSSRVAKIWWLASYPKSGNTWLRMFLSAYRHNGQIDINEPHELLTDDLQPYFMQVCAPCGLKELNDLEKAMLRPAALMHLMQVHNPRVPLFVKTHNVNGKLGGVPLIPTEMAHGAVYLVRDPRDVAVSFAEHRRETIDAVIHAMSVRDHLLRRPPLYHVLSSWSEHVRSWSRAKALNVLVIRYEDMLAKPHFVFENVLGFIHHNIDRSLINRSVAATRFDMLQRQEKANGFREKAGGDLFFARGRAGVWRDELTRQQSERVEMDHREMMQEFGYL